jgi:multidrug resistance efflux pump
MAHIHSVEAHIDSDTYSVGIEYASIIEKQSVEENASVKAGDPLFELRSPSLAESIRENEVAAASLLYSVTPKGTVLITATAAGKVRTISKRVGDFVPANSELAKINLEKGLYIKATYKLAAPDYARLRTGSKITVSLPDGVKLDGKVYDIRLATRDKQVYTTVKARIDQSKVNRQAFTTGTPVESVLTLNNDTRLSRLNRYVRQLIEPSGK